MDTSKVFKALSSMNEWRDCRKYEIQALLFSKKSDHFCRNNPITKELSICKIKKPPQMNEMVLIFFLVIMEK